MAKNVKNKLKQTTKYIAYILGVFALIMIPLGNSIDYLLYYDTNDIRFSSWQIPLTFLIYLVLWLALFLCLFKKYYIRAIILASFTLFLFPETLYTLPDYKLIRNIDICDDIEYCVEGTRDWVTQEDCETKNKAWNIDDIACQYRFDLKDCYRLKGNWQYPTACDSKNAYN